MCNLNMQMTEALEVFIILTKTKKHFFDVENIRRFLKTIQEIVYLLTEGFDYLHY